MNDYLKGSQRVSCFLVVAAAFLLNGRPKGSRGGPSARPRGPGGSRMPLKPSQGKQKRPTLASERDAGWEPLGILGILGLILGISLSLLILGVLGYTLARWCQEGSCWHRSNFVFNLYHIRSLAWAEVELAPPFTISSPTKDTGGGYMWFHRGGP